MKLFPSLAGWFGRRSVYRKFWRGEYGIEEPQRCLCGSESFTRVASKDSFGLPMGVKLCMSCGLGLLAPRITSEELSQFYEQDYRILYRGGKPLDDEYFERGVRRGKKISEYITSAVPGFTPKLVVEIGCGPGGILSYFKEQGCEVVGCEYDAACIDMANKQGVRVIKGDATSLLKEVGTVDLVILNHLLEHIDNPSLFLKTVMPLLSKEGLLFIEVPGLRNYNNNFFASIQVAHLYYFDLSTLHALVSSNGMNLITGDEKVRALYSFEGNLKIQPAIENGSHLDEICNLNDNYNRNMKVVESWRVSSD